MLVMTWTVCMTTVKYADCMNMVGGDVDRYVMMDLEDAQSSLGVDEARDLVTCVVPEGGVLFLNNLIPHRYDSLAAVPQQLHSPDVCSSSTGPSTNCFARGTLRSPRSCSSTGLFPTGTLTLQLFITNPMGVLTSSCSSTYLVPPGSLKTQLRLALPSRGHRYTCIFFQ